MTTYCVVKALNMEWIVKGDVDRQQCGIQGGVLEDRPDGGCGASSAAAMTFGGIEENGFAGIAAEVVVTPLRQFRSLFSGTEFLSKLERMNKLLGPELGRLSDRHDVDFQQEIARGLTVASLVASCFIGHSRHEMSKMIYTAHMHAGLSAVALRLADRCENKESRDAIASVLDQAGDFVDKNFNQIKTRIKTRSKRPLSQLGR